MKPFATIFLLAGICAITLAWYPPEMTHRDSELLQQREAVRVNYEKRKKEAVQHAEEVNKYYQIEQETPPWRVSELRASISRKKQDSPPIQANQPTAPQQEPIPIPKSKRTLLPVATLLFLGGVAFWVRRVTEPNLIHP